MLRKGVARNCNISVQKLPHVCTHQIVIKESPAFTKLIDSDKLCCMILKLSAVYEYVGDQIRSDNGLIPQNQLLKSEFYYPLHVTMGVAYSCLHGVFITT